MKQRFSVVRTVIALSLLMPLTGLAEERTVRELRMEPIDPERGRTVPIKVYFDGSNGPQPVVLFSHGLGGSRENNAYLGEYWAASGYVAVFLQHPGSDETVWRSSEVGGRMAALMAAANAENLQQRLADVSFVLDQLEVWNGLDGHQLSRKLDLEHIGMSGHSFGAVTTLAVAGRKFPLGRSFLDERIDAFLALSPQLGAGIGASEAFGHLKKPILCMTGTEDGNPIDPSLEASTRREVFVALPVGDKYQLVLEGAEHFAFGDNQRGRIRRRNAKHHPAIQKISLQFWDAYLRGTAVSKQWLQSTRAITETGLTVADVWEWK